jgi:VanW like protein/Glycosyl transferases group 1
VPTRLAAASLRLRVWGHVAIRAWCELRDARVERHRAAPSLLGASVIAEHRSPLWRDGRDEEFALVAGKVENLRIARRAFDGVVVPAGAVFSFWKQLGRPTRSRGFVEGREIRAGCVVPVVAGGLCQLSNALAACAVECGMTLVERHGHTARIEQHATSGASDATVFWNYVDLRIVAPFDWRLEVEMTGDALVVRMRAAQAPGRATAARSIPLVAEKSAAPLARGCLTCDETACYRHPGEARAPTTGTTAVLVGAWTPEFARYLQAHAAEADWFTPWMRRARRVAGAWAPAQLHAVAVRASWRRTWLLRRSAGEGGGRQAATMRGQRWLAEAYARRLEPRHAHLIVDQALLLPLARIGALQGRTYDVLMHALPNLEVQRRLDVAAQRWPAAASLRDFREHSAEGEAELRALRAARRLVTPHADVARHLRGDRGVTVDEIPWQLPARLPGRAARRVPSTPPVVAFPASALARKGALEMAEAMRHLGWRLLVLGTPSTDAGLWCGIEVEHVGYRDLTWLDRADVVALPAHVEHSPRALLLAVAHGLPVVATACCGLPTSPGMHTLVGDDVASLVAALETAVAARAEESLTAS